MEIPPFHDVFRLLESDSSLGNELNISPKLRSAVFVDRCMQRAGAEIDHGPDSEEVSACKAEQQGVSENMSSRMNRTAQYAFADHLEAFYREPRFG